MIICKKHNHNYPHQVDGEGACPSCEPKDNPEQPRESRDQPNRKKKSAEEQPQKTFSELSKHVPTDPLRSLSDMSSAVAEPDE
jgi:uncharacterized Zn finger protein (UPF0148 family)